MQSKNLVLKKKFYGVHKAHNDLDREFRELIPKEMTVNEFFRMYNEMFYELSLTTHNDFLSRSTNYAFPEGYTHPKKIEEADLRKQLFEIQKLIDSIEKEHFFFKNNRLLVLEGNIFNNDGNLLSVGEHGPYLMHSGRKRKINDIGIYRNLKVKYRSTYQPMTDNDTVIPVTEATLNGIQTGPPINSSSDIYISNLAVNVYPLSLEEYYDEIGEINLTSVETALPIRDTD